ncbi:hypothetical protein [Noviherbaspirillum sp. Root189]|uniref:hypothetical protein n=1 Tax=Noviherbaspirillum sp. Root189 TaxID=1736487 RepID=UPI0012E3D9CD|nr:hypothetical protein [Noviherbaspirillum sp. Root189]
MRATEIFRDFGYAETQKGEQDHQTLQARFLGYLAPLFDLTKHQIGNRAQH